MVTSVTTIKVVTVRDFRDHATAMFRSDDIILITRDGKPAGFFIPWGKQDLPVELHRELFTQLGGHARAGSEDPGTPDNEILTHFAEWRAESIHPHTYSPSPLEGEGAGG